MNNGRWREIAPGSPAERAAAAAGLTFHDVHAALADADSDARSRRFDAANASIDAEHARRVRRKLFDGQERARAGQRRALRTIEYLKWARIARGEFAWGGFAGDLATADASLRGVTGLIVAASGPVINLPDAYPAVGPVPSQPGDSPTDPDGESQVPL